MHWPLITGHSIVRSAQMWCIHHTCRSETPNDGVWTSCVTDSVRVCSAYSTMVPSLLMGKCQAHVITWNLVINSDQVSTPDMAWTRVKWNPLLCRIFAEVQNTGLNGSVVCRFSLEFQFARYHIVLCCGHSDSCDLTHRYTVSCQTYLRCSSQD